MPNSLNSCNFIGSLGKDPEMRFSTSGNPFTTFSIACNHSYKKNDDWVKETEWVNIQVWGKTAEACNTHLSKGSRVFVEGRLKTRSWDTDGQKHYKTEVIANQVIFLDGKKDNEQVEEESEDIPF